VTPSATSVVVVGGGIAGLACAWELTGGAEADPDAPRVTVIESARRLGGPLHSVPFAGRVVDVGPDGFLGRRPEAAALCREAGLGDLLRPIGASGASIYARGRLRPLPADLLLGVPTRWRPVARSGVLGARGTLRLLRDEVLPRADRRGPLGDRALGPLVARRLGRQVVESLVDPLIGGIHAGSVADMSTAALLPQLLAAPRRGSLMRALRRANRTAARATIGEQAPPAFYALEGGMATMVAGLERRLEERGVEVRTSVAAERLQRGTERAWVVSTSAGPCPAHGVVLAVPAPVAADLLAPHDADAAALERSVEYGSVAVITLLYPEDEVTLPPGTGFLVPRGTRSPLAAAAGEDLLLTAGTFLDRKWPHLRQDGTVLLRASVGRFGDRRPEQLDDAELANRAAAELGAVLSLAATPTASMVTRWRRAFPQYKVGHLLRVSGVEAAVRRLPSLAVAGAPYRGVGIPACVASGREAARSVREALGGGPPARP
jgi:protoporphyrinogen/coproporphyrinogen III oxidase